MTSMDITCGDCGARFRLDKALLKDSHAARIRCRKCGGPIVVRVSEESSAPPAAGASGEFRPEPPLSPVPPPQEPSPPPVVEAEAPAQKPTAFEADISGVVRSEIVPSPPDEKAVPPDNERIEPEPERATPGAVYSRLEDLFAPPDMEAGPDRIPPPPEESPAGENAREQTAATESRRKAPPRRAHFMLKVLVIAVLWILLLAAGALYFGTTKQGQETLGNLFAGWGSGRTGSAPAKPVYDIRDVKWYIDKDSAAGNLFVIKGAVANVGNAPSAGIRIQATLLGKDNVALAEQAAFAGNLIDEASLRRTDRAAIEEVMSTRFGKGNVNREIPKDKALPFMVVFFDPEGTVESFIVRAIDVE